MSITEEEKQRFLKNEEKLWDLAALTSAPTALQIIAVKNVIFTYEQVAAASYDLADALMAERRKRLTKDLPKI